MQRVNLRYLTGKIDSEMFLVLLATLTTLCFMIIRSVDNHIFWVDAQFLIVTALYTIGYSLILTSKEVSVRELERQQKIQREYLEQAEKENQDLRIINHELEGYTGLLMSQIAEYKKHSNSTNFNR